MENQDTSQNEDSNGALISPSPPSSRPWQSVTSSGIRATLIVSATTYLTATGKFTADTAQNIFLALATGLTLPALLALLNKGKAK